jgi:hypothetical protein
MNSEALARIWQAADRPSWRSFLTAIVALGTALFLAIYSGAAAQHGHLPLAAVCALTALGLAGWVAFTIVPVLARRTPLQWLTYQIDYQVTREGVIYLAGIFVVALAALNTGNNLLFMILSCLLAGVLISGILSRLVLSAVDVRLDLPEHIFAGQSILAVAELHNTKQRMPTFSVSLVSEEKEASKKQGGKLSPNILSRPVYFPYVPARKVVKQDVELTFPRRGVYRQDAFGLRTRFPFGFIQKTRRVDSGIEAVVYPTTRATREIFDALPQVTGELESYQRGRGNDLYAIRDYQHNDSARHVDWKASAKTGVLQIREFAREDERRVMLVFDPYRGDPNRTPEQFELAVNLCAGLAWHFSEMNSVIEFRSAGFATPRAPANEVIYDILRYLASVTALKPQPGRNFLDSLADAQDIFKVVLTSQNQEGIPTLLHGSSYILHANTL